MPTNNNQSPEIAPKKRNSGRNGGRKCKIPWDNPELLDNILENRALGLSWRLIAESLGENESTVRGWLERKDFRQKLAIKKAQILRVPLQAMAERFPKDYIERHKETRDDFIPPTQRQEVTFTLTTAWERAGDEEKAALLAKLQAEIEELDTPAQIEFVDNDDSL